jgi:hypothetical protein
MDPWLFEPSRIKTVGKIRVISKAHIYKKTAIFRMNAMAPGEILKITE